MKEILLSVILVVVYHLPLLILASLADMSFLRLGIKLQTKKILTA
jgi:hypothetical protein